MEKENTTFAELVHEAIRNVGHNTVKGQGRHDAIRNAVTRVLNTGVGLTKEEMLSMIASDERMDGSANADNTSWSHERIEFNSDGTIPLYWVMKIMIERGLVNTLENMIEDRFTEPKVGDTTSPCSSDCATQCCGATPDCGGDSGTVGIEDQDARKRSELGRKIAEILVKNGYSTNQPRAEVVEKILEIVQEEEQSLRGRVESANNELISALIRSGTQRIFLRNALKFAESHIKKHGIWTTSCNYNIGDVLRSENPTELVISVWK